MNRRVERDDKLERELSAWLDGEAPGQAPEALRRRVMAAVPQTRQRSRWPVVVSPPRTRPVVGFAMAAAAVFVAAVLVIGLLATAPLKPAGSPSPSPSAGAPTPYPVAATFAGGSNFPVVAASSVWAPQFEAGTVIRVDPTTDALLATIPVGAQPHAMAAHESGVYVSVLDDEGPAILHIDPASNEVVKRIPASWVGWAMAVSGDTLWMTTFDRNLLVRVDLNRGEVVEQIRNVSNGLGVGADEENVYVAIGGLGYLMHLDVPTGDATVIETGTRTTTIPLLREQEVWLTTLDSAQVLVVSRDTHEVLARIQTQFPLGITEHDGLMWVTDGSASETSLDERIVGIDPDTREIVRVLPMPGYGLDRGIVGHGDSLWVITVRGLTRVDLRP